MDAATSPGRLPSLPLWGEAAAAGRAVTLPGGGAAAALIDRASGRGQAGTGTRTGIGMLQGAGAGPATTQAGAAARPQAARLQPAGSGRSLANLTKSAHDFEAMAIGQLLAPMFDTVNTAQGPFGGGSAETAWKPLLVDAIGKKIAASGGLGLAGSVYQALLRAQEQPTRRTK